MATIHAHVGAAIRTAVGIALICHAIKCAITRASQRQQQQDRGSLFDAILQVVLLPLVLVRGPSRTCRRVTCMSTLVRPTGVVPTSTRLDSTRLGGFMNWQLFLSTSHFGALFVQLYSYYQHHRQSRTLVAS
ncbi:hypothetical protein V8C43DRAFT_270308 [Trichoderma afarasin]